MLYLLASTPTQKPLVGYPTWDVTEFKSSAYQLCDVHDFIDDSSQPYFRSAKISRRKLGRASDAGKRRGTRTGALHWRCLDAAEARVKYTNFWKSKISGRFRSERLLGPKPLYLRRFYEYLYLNLQNLTAFALLPSALIMLDVRTGC